MIRGKWADDSKNAGVEHYTLHKDDQLMRPNKGYERLKNFTSLDPENGRPIFTPYYINDRNKMEDDSIKRCMFSIENLAWKDIIPDSTLIRKGKDDIVNSILNADHEAGINCIMISEKRISGPAKVLIEKAENDRNFAKLIDDSFRKIVEYKMKSGFFDFYLNSNGDFVLVEKNPVLQDINSRLEEFNKARLEDIDIYQTYF